MNPSYLGLKPVNCEPKATFLSPNSVTYYVFVAMVKTLVNAKVKDKVVSGMQLESEMQHSGARACP